MNSYREMDQATADRIMAAAEEMMAGYGTLDTSANPAVQTVKSANARPVRRARSAAAPTSTSPATPPAKEIAMLIKEMSDEGLRAHYTHLRGACYLGAQLKDRKLGKYLRELDITIAVARKRGIKL